MLTLVFLYLVAYTLSSVSWSDYSSISAFDAYAIVSTSLYNGLYELWLHVGYYAELLVSVDDMLYGFAEITGSLLELVGVSSVHVMDFILLVGCNVSSCVGS